MKHTDKTTKTASAPETRILMSDGTPMNEASQKASDAAWAFSHQGKVHAMNLKRRAKREATKAKRRAEMETGRVPLIDGARQPNWTQIQRDAGNAPKRTIPAEKPTAWEDLANESIADAGYWKAEARKAQTQAVQLAEALRDMCNSEFPDFAAATRALDAYESEVGK